MGRRDQAEEMTQAADRIVEATKELSATINRWIEYQNYWYSIQVEEQSREWNPEFGWPVVRQDRVSLSEHDAIEIAMEEVRSTREEIADVGDQQERLPPPSSVEIVEWERRRETRRREGN